MSESEKATILTQDDLKTFSKRSLSIEELKAELGTTTYLIPKDAKISLGGDSGQGSWDVMNDFNIELTEIRYLPEENRTVVIGMLPVRLNDNENTGNSGSNGANTVSFTLE